MKINIEWCNVTNQFVAHCDEVTGLHTQALSFYQLLDNLKDVIELCDFNEIKKALNKNTEEQIKNLLSIKYDDNSKEKNMFFKKD